jgi:hypothetical protein
MGGVVSESRKLPSRRPGLLYRAMMSVVGLLEPLLFMSCRAFIRLASERYERPLWPGERTRQAMHRAVCRICRLQERRMNQLRELARELGHRGGEGAEAELSSESLRRLRAAVAEAAAREMPQGGGRS